MTKSNGNAVVASTWRRPVSAPATIPESVDIVVIGGGIVGVSTAWFLAKQGVSVALCEKAHIACEQSGRNWGWVRAQGRDPRELPLMLSSLDIWRTLSEEIGEDVGFEEGGCMFAARTEKALEDFASWMDIAQQHGMSTRVVAGEELDKLVTGSTIKWKGALYTENDGRAEPHKAAPAIARAAEKAGAHILTGCAVRGLDIEAGRVAGVVTEHGRIRCSTVLCAAGAWAARFCRSLGLELPQLKVRAVVARTEPGGEVLEGNLFDDDVGIRRRDDGGYTVAPGAILEHSITPSSFRHFFTYLPALRDDFGIMKLRFGRDFFDELRQPKRWDLDTESPFEETRVLDPEPPASIVRKLRKDVDKLFPALAGQAFAETWAGMIESLPDVIPVIDAWDDLPGFHLATGFSGHGFGIGPGAGRAAAQMLTGQEPDVDLSGLRLSRFFDGSKIRPHAPI